VLGWATKRRVRWLVIAVVLLGSALAGKHCMLDDGAVPETSSFEIDLDTLRRLAAAPAPRDAARGDVLPRGAGARAGGT
jgi:hypothetical protein